MNFDVTSTKASERPDIEKLLDLFLFPKIRRLPNQRRMGLSVPFARLCRSYRFLHLIVGRYDELNRQYIESNDLVWDVFNQGATGDKFTAKECVILDENRLLHDKVHLEIESFYIFAKVFLDRIAQYIQSHFGRLSGKQKDLLRSHHSLVINLPVYATAKNLEVSPALLSAASALYVAIIKLRDRYIVHDDSDRTMHGTLIDPMGKSRLTMHRINPHEHERQGVKSEHLQRLLSEIDEYVSLVIAMLKSNQQHTPLEP